MIDTEQMPSAVGRRSLATHADPATPSTTPTAVRGPEARTSAWLRGRRGTAGRTVATGFVVASVVSALTMPGAAVTSAGPGPVSVWTTIRIRGGEHHRWFWRPETREERRPPIAYVAAGPPSASRAPRPTRRRPFAGRTIPPRNAKRRGSVGGLWWIASPECSGGCSGVARGRGLGAAF